MTRSVVVDAALRGLLKFSATEWSPEDLKHAEQRIRKDLFSGVESAGDRRRAGVRARVQMTPLLMPLVKLCMNSATKWSPKRVKYTEGRSRKGGFRRVAGAGARVLGAPAAQQQCAVIPPCSGAQRPLRFVGKINRRIPPTSRAWSPQGIRCSRTKYHSYHNHNHE